MDFPQFATVLEVLWIIASLGGLILALFMVYEAIVDLRYVGLAETNHVTARQVIAGGSLRKAVSCLFIMLLFMLIGIFAALVQAVPMRLLTAPVPLALTLLRFIVPLMLFSISLLISSNMLLDLRDKHRLLTLYSEPGIPLAGVAAMILISRLSNQVTNGWEDLIYRWSIQMARNYKKKQDRAAQDNHGQQ